MVSTSPAFTAWPGAVSRAPLTRTWPASTSAAALVRALTTRACHNHLSRRWRSKQHRFEMTGWDGLAILAVGGELFLERRQFGKGRIGIDRTIALARTGAGRVLPVRGTAARTVVTIALFAAAFIAV